ncbi:MAG TPA: DUF4266 domain-containing protein [Candidatus Saccharimonadia bacterium]|nr:DUF4266 domain-containing protein [Candidatus Saccharimonadia bacterium]
MRRPVDLAVRFVALMLLGLLAGCATQQVAPWERGRLARWDMQFDPDALDAAMREHTYSSKEAVAGSLAPAGAGCGCN